MENNFICVGNIFLGKFSRKTFPWFFLYKTLATFFRVSNYVFSAKLIATVLLHKYNNLPRDLFFAYLYETQFA